MLGPKRQFRVGVGFIGFGLQRSGGVGGGRSPLPSTETWEVRSQKSKKPKAVMLECYW